MALYHIQYHIVLVEVLDHQMSLHLYVRIYLDLTCRSVMLFNGLKLHTLLFGFSMALIDVFVLGGLKAKHLGMLNGFWMLPIAMTVYALQPILFYKSLSFESLTVMNLIWDLSSDVLVTIMGLFYFAEKLSPRRMIGVGLSLISLMLLSCE